MRAESLYKVYQDRPKTQSLAIITTTALQQEVSALEIATSIIASMERQSMLLLSLSTAILGGTAALAVQLKIKDSKILPLPLNFYFIIGALLLGASCLSSWAVLGALINKTPVIMAIQFNGQEIFKIDKIKESTALLYLSNFQFFSFIFGVLLTAFGFIRLERE